MTAVCVAASIGPANVEDAKLQNVFGEDILQAYVMAAVETTAGGDDSPPAAASLLHQGRAQQNVSKRIAEVPLEQQVGYVEEMQRGLHDVQDETVLSPSPVVNFESLADVPENAIVDVQKVTEAVPELAYVNESSSELNKIFNESCEKYLKVSAATESLGTAIKGSYDTEVVAVVSDDPSKVITIEELTVIAGLSPDVVVEEGADIATHSANVQVPRTELDVVQRHGGANDDGEVSERVATEGLKDSHAAEVNDDVLFANQSYRIENIVTSGYEAELVARNDPDGAPSRLESRVDVDPALKVGSEAKVEVLYSQAANVVDIVDNSTMISRSFSFTGLNHVAFCVENLERSLDFYCGLLGLQTNVDRPELPYRGAWLSLGAEGIHIMEVPNPDPVNGRPVHGGFDRHACLNCKNVEGVRVALEKAGIPYQPSIVPSVFTRDPDGNGLEFIEVDS